jgi:hypothetical protein
MGVIMTLFSGGRRQELQEAGGEVPEAEGVVMIFSEFRRQGLIEAAGTITVASAKAALNKELFRLDSKDQSRMMRMVNVSTGVTIKEFAKAKMVKKTRQIEPTSDRFYRVSAYRGEDPKGRWNVSPEFANLKDAVGWANEHAAVAASTYESKQEAKTKPKKPTPIRLTKGREGAGRGSEGVV